MSDEHPLTRLTPDWYEYVLIEGVNESLPGIYQWTIDGRGNYIGKYKRIRRPLKEYGRNVRKILSGKDYRPSKPDGFRRIHRELAQALREGRRITLTILENVAQPRINERERELISERGALNDPPFDRRTPQQY